MSEHTPQRPEIELRLEGPAVPGRVSVDLLTALAKELQTSLRRMLASPRRSGGRFPTEIEQTCALDLTGFARGSARVTFEYARERQPDLLHGDLGLRAAEELLDALRKVEVDEPGWRDGLPPGMVDGWAVLAKPLAEGVDTVRITLRGGPSERSVQLTRAFREHLRATRVAEPGPAQDTVEGVLWECDWKARTALLEEIDGHRVTLTLPAGMDERVTELRKQLVRVTGTVEQRHGRPIRVAVTAVTPVRTPIDSGDPRFGGFWENLGVDELARRQGVGPVQDLTTLTGDWPPEDSIDDFLEFLRGVRRG